MIYCVIIILIVIALNEILKRTGIIEAKAIPLSSITLSAFFYLAYTGFDIIHSIIAGFLLGIFTTGIYSFVKSISKWLRTPKQ